MLDVYFMRLFLKISIFFLALFFSQVSFSDSTQDCLGDNSLPMYGYDSFYKENSCDKKFIKSTLEVIGMNRVKAAKEISKKAWDLLLIEKDPSQAINRFNQAWLLDRNSFEVFWGFAVWEAERNNLQKAEEFFDKAVRENSKTPELLVDYSKVLIEIGFAKDDDKRIQKARKFLNTAKSLNSKLPSVYVQSASFYINSGLKLFRKAWEEIEVAKTISSDSIPAKLISDLERIYPRKK